MIVVGDVGADVLRDLFLNVTSTFSPVSSLILVCQLETFVVKSASSCVTCDFAVADEEAIFGLSEVNWGIIPGGVVSWNVAKMLMPRHAMYYAATGRTFNGKRAVEIGLVNSAVPKARLREETLDLAMGLMKLNPNVLRYTKEAIRAVVNMDVETARDYLQVKQDSLARADKEIDGRVGMNKFLDDKAYRPGLGPYQR